MADHHLFVVGYSAVGAHQCFVATVLETVFEPVGIDIGFVEAEKGLYSFGFVFFAALAVSVFLLLVLFVIEVFFVLGLIHSDCY